MHGRNIEIASEYDGRNLDKLRLKYGMTVQQVKWVLKQEGMG